MSSENTPTPTTFPSQDIKVPANEKSTKSEIPKVHKLKGENSKNKPSTPDSMNVEVGSDIGPESEFGGSEISPETTESQKQEDLGSEGSWEEVRHEPAKEKTNGGDNEEKKEAAKKETAEEEVAPEFRPRTPRPYHTYGGHST